MRRRVNLMATALFIAVALSWLLADLATADAWCVAPGPRGEAIYCTDGLDALPSSAKGKAERRSTRLEHYRKLTVQLQQPALHDWNNAWCFRCELWRNYHRRWRPCRR